MYHSYYSGGVTLITSFSRASLELSVSYKIFLLSPTVTEGNKRPIDLFHSHTYYQHPLSLYRITKSIIWELQRPTIHTSLVCLALYIPVAQISCCEMALRHRNEKSIYGQKLNPQTLTWGTEKI